MVALECPVTVWLILRIVQNMIEYFIQSQIMRRKKAKVMMTSQDKEPMKRHDSEMMKTLMRATQWLLLGQPNSSSLLLPVCHAAERLSIRSSGRFSRRLDDQQGSQKWFCSLGHRDAVSEAVWAAVTEERRSFPPDPRCRPGLRFKPKPSETFRGPEPRIFRVVQESEPLRINQRRNFIRSWGSSVNLEPEAPSPAAMFVLTQHASDATDVLAFN